METALVDHMDRAALIRTVAQMVDREMSYGEIALRLGCSKGVVAGIVFRLRNPVPAPLRSQSLARERRRARTERREAVARKLSAGWTYSEIARHLGCSIGTVAGIAFRLRPANPDVMRTARAT